MPRAHDSLIAARQGATGKTTACIHLGEVLDLAPMGCCGGRSQAKIYACHVHARCALTSGVTKWVCPCPDFEP